MKPLKSDIKRDATLLINSSIESIFTTLHQKYKTSSGDITPNQRFELNRIQKELHELIAEQVFQNLDFTRFDLDALTRDELIELAYSLDWNGSWDADEEGQEPITRDELIESIINLISYH